jgi:hypothetical protein
VTLAAVKADIMADRFEDLSHRLIEMAAVHCVTITFACGNKSTLSQATRSQVICAIA